MIEAKLPQVDNPKTINFLNELHAELDGVMNKIKKFGRKNYPDWFPKDDGDKTVEVETPKVEPEMKTPPAVARKDWNPIIEALAKLQDQLKSQKETLYRITGR